VSQVWRELAGCPHFWHRRKPVLTSGGIVEVAQIAAIRPSTKPATAMKKNDAIMDESLIIGRVAQKQCNQWRCVCFSG
jgi:hypothetical protein